MSFSETVKTMDATLEATFCDTPATWAHAGGADTINVCFSEEPVYQSEDAIQIQDYDYQAECSGQYIISMQRGDELIINQQRYQVMSHHTDSEGWATIQLQKL